MEHHIAKAFMENFKQESLEQQVEYPCSPAQTSKETLFLPRGLLILSNHGSMETEIFHPTSHAWVVHVHNLSYNTTLCRYYGPKNMRDCKSGGLLQKTNGWMEQKLKRKKQNPAKGSNLYECTACQNFQQHIYRICLAAYLGGTSAFMVACELVQ